jgi:hypothetical protein
MTGRTTPCLWIGCITTLIVGALLGASLYRAFAADQNIWWTPPSMSLSLEASGGHFELYICGKRLQNHVSDGTLYAVDKAGTRYRVAPGDVGVRLNNWPEVQAAILTQALWSSLAFGAAVCLLVTGLVQAFQRRSP